MTECGEDEKALWRIYLSRCFALPLGLLHKLVNCVNENSIGDSRCRSFVLVFCLSSFASLEGQSK